MHNLPQDISRDLDGWTIAFDLDGTLVDTAPDLVGALNTLLEEEGLTPPPYGEMRNLIGHGGRWMLNQALEKVGVLPTSTELDDLFERFLVLYRARIADESRPFEGCLEALDALAARGATLAVCTNKRTSLSVALLDALGMTARFAAVVGADLAAAPKPDPRHLLLCIDRAGGDASRAVLVGDSSSDTLAARAAGVPCIVVGFGYTQTPAAELGGTCVIGHFRELAGALAALPPCRVEAGSL